jgi:hypothetical protein
LPVSMRTGPKRWLRRRSDGTSVVTVRLVQHAMRLGPACSNADQPTLRRKDPSAGVCQCHLRARVRADMVHPGTREACGGLRIHERMTFRAAPVTVPSDAQAAVRLRSQPCTIVQGCSQAIIHAAVQPSRVGPERAAAAGDIANEWAYRSRSGIDAAGGAGRLW